MAPRRGAAVEEEEPEQDGDLMSLQFDEPLTWRPGKPIPTEQLLKRLTSLSKELEQMEQETTNTASLNKVAKEVASHPLLTHKDKGVRAHTACCIVEILRLCAPNAPFTESQLKDIFNLCVNAIIPALFDPSNPYNSQHKHVLRSFAEVKSIVLLNEVDGSDNLLLSLFSNIFDGVSSSKSAAGEQVAKDVQFAMQEILLTLIDEAGGLPAKVVDVIMAQFLRAAAPGGMRDKQDNASLDENQGTLLLKEEPEAYQMAKTICQTFPDKMARFVSQYFSDVILDATSFAGKSNGHKDAEDSEDENALSGPSESDMKELKKAHVLIRELWRAAPLVLQNVVPQVDAELNADHVHLRQLATETLGDMVSGIGAAGPPPPPVIDPSAYPPLRWDEEDRTEAIAASVLTTPLSAISFSQTHPVTFHNFLSRKIDKAAQVRTAWTVSAGYIVSTSAGGIGLSREDETALIKGLGEKLTDSDEKVRLAAVKAIESFKFQDVVTKLGHEGGVGKEGSVLSNLADRCRDRKPAVRVAAMALLGRIWAAGCGELLAGNEVVTAAISGIPSRILKCFYANDTELNVLIDRALYEFLVPLAYPPAKKGGKNPTGGSQSQSAPSAADADAIRAERILILFRGLDAEAKKALFVLQARQPQFSNVVETYIKQCDLYNGGVMDENADRKTANLTRSLEYIAQFMPDPIKAKNDLQRFAKANDRRNYYLIRYVIGKENDFKTVYKALKELIKRVQASKEPAILDTLLPLLYRSGCILFNRSHLSTIMDYSKSDKNGMGAIAHEILNEVSQRNPDLFKSHIGQLCKDLVEQAPTASKPNDPAVVETLKACASYCRKYPKEVPLDRQFAQTLISYALYGQPYKAAKYAVNILLSKQDSKTPVHATDLIQKIMKDFKYGSPNFLNKLTAVAQLELHVPAVTAEYEDTILNMAVQQIVLEIRTEASAKDPEWVDDADLDEEIQLKLVALKLLVKRLHGVDEAEAKERTKPVWKMLKKLITEKGELGKTKDTPKHHRSRLRLLAAQLLMKLCKQKHFDDVLVPAEFNSLAWTTQDPVAEVRHGFLEKLQKYLAEGKLRTRFYTIVFLAAFEPVTEFKHRLETWVRSRALYFQNQSVKQPVMEAIIARLIHLLAHHPDYSPELDSLVDHARYLLFYVSLVATEANLGVIYKYAERIKQTQDSLSPTNENHRVLSDLAQAVIRKWQEKKNWTFQAYPDKIGLPVGLYAGLKSHDEAQAAAEKQYIPDGIDEKLDELLRAIDRKKKRKPADDRHDHPSKRSRTVPRLSAANEPKPPKPPKAPKPASKKVKAKAKKPAKVKKTSESAATSSSQRRRSGRAHTSQSYIERDDDEDDEEMLEGVAEWEYEDDDSDEDSGTDGSGDESQEENEKKAQNGDGESSDLSDPEDAQEEAEDQEEDEDKGEDNEGEEEELPPAKSNGRKGRAAAGPKTKAKPAKSKASAKPAPAKTSTRATRGRRANADDDEMDEDD
ncbi:hypothetical protein GQ53DRAFT_804612 [Thozetella sp. PMI_491]|nr:hypothetical protein GQ53DRAFT_804612 [Thozetella sp. PMI_491]